MKTPEQNLLQRLQDESMINTEAYIHLINNYFPCLDEDQLFKILSNSKEFVDENERQSILHKVFETKPHDCGPENSCTILP